MNDKKCVNSHICNKVKKKGSQSILHWFWLNFSQTNLNRVYYYQKSEYDKKIFYIISIFINVNYLIDSIQNIFQLDLFFFGLFRLIELVFFLICTFMVKKNFIFSQIGILSIFLADQIANYIYIYNLFLQLASGKGLILLGFSVVFRLFSVLFAIRQWYIKGLCLAIWVIIIIVNLSNNIGNSLYAIVMASFTIICIYLVEKRQKLNYYQLEQQQQDLRDWKKLMNDHIPIIVFKAQRQKIDNQNEQLQVQFSFDNQACRNLLKHQNYSDIEQLTKQIQIDNELLNNDQNQEYFKNKNLHQIIQDQLINHSTMSSCKLINDDIQQQDIIEQMNFYNLQFNCQLQKQQANAQMCNNRKEYLINFHVQIVWISSLELIIVINDISQQQRVQLLQSLNLYKNKILQSITHDLKTPLNGIVSIIEASQKCSNLQIMHQLQGVIKKNAMLLNNMINQILDYCDIMKSRLKLKIEQFNLKNSILSVVDLFEDQMNQKQLKFKLKYNIDQDTIIENDKMRLQEILLVMMHNAVKYTQKGEIILEISSFDESCFQFIVEDTGIGMNQQTISSIGNLFSQSIQQIKNLQHGAGLGLTITHFLLQYLGPLQKMIVMSNINQGSIFSFKIYKKNSEENCNKITTNFFGLDMDDQRPSKQDVYHQLNSALSIECKHNQIIEPQSTIIIKDQQKRTSIFRSENNINYLQNDQIMSKQRIEESDMQDSQYTDEYTGRKQEINKMPYTSQHCSKFRANYQINNNVEQIPKKKVLIVDDVPYNIFGLQLLLQNCQQQFISDSAYNGQEALDKVLEAQSKNSQFDIIFLDINMPVMDGIETTKLLRLYEQQKQINKVFIIIVTTLSNEQEKQFYLDIGADSLLPKPIMAEDLQNLINTLLGISIK